MRWSAERRLLLIDFRLYWEGRINRKDLIDFFGISVPQASADLARYQKEAPENIDYDKSGKFYFATKKFKPVFFTPKSSDYLSQLRLIYEGIFNEDEAFIGNLPDFDGIPNPSRNIDPEVLRKVINAINTKRALNIKYQSMSRSEPTWRIFVPHTFAYDGFRWHVRAFCYEHNTFRDFLLGRIFSVKDYKSDEVDTSKDILWNTFVTAKFSPHPKLKDAQKKVIERDYGMKNGVGSVKVRAALYFYLEKRLGLDEDCESRPPNVQQIVLINRDEINKLLESIKNKSVSSI